MSNYTRCCSCGEDADTDAVICSVCDQKFDAATKERHEQAVREAVAERTRECAKRVTRYWVNYPGKGEAHYADDELKRAYPECFPPAVGESK